MDLVADIGGTNTRIAQAGADGLLSGTLRSYRNDAFSSFDAALETYCTEADVQGIQRCCVAIAGPVSAEEARLTNRNWVMNRARISAALHGADVVLINDLAALGYGVPSLTDETVEVLKPEGPRRLNGQSLVLGLGTGVNLCLCHTSRSGARTVLEAEAGHSALPQTVATALQAAIGAAAGGFPTVEETLAGRGVAGLHRAMTGESFASSDIVAAGQTGADPVARNTVHLAADVLGQLVRELLLLYLPLDGVYLAGGVARGLLGGSGRAAFLDALSRAPHFSADTGNIPIALIRADEAGLHGCAAYLSGSAA